MLEFGKQYGIRFNDPGLLKLALTHRSYLHVTGQGPRESNERLEFLGDSVLGLVTSELLYRANPTEHEVQITNTTPSVAEPVRTNARRPRREEKTALTAAPVSC